MFRWFSRDPVKKLEAEYLRLLQTARDRQRNGDIEGFAEWTARAEAVGTRIEEMRRQR